MIIDRVSTLRRGVEADEALGFSNETCGQSMPFRHRGPDRLGRKLTLGLVTFHSIIHYKHEKLIKTLMFKPEPSLAWRVSEVVNFANPVREDSIGLNKVFRVN